MSASLDAHTPPKFKIWLWGSLSLLLLTVGAFTLTHSASVLPWNNSPSGPGNSAATPEPGDLAQADLALPRGRFNSTATSPPASAQTPSAATGQVTSNDQPAAHSTPVDSEAPPAAAANFAARQSAAELQQRRLAAIRKKYPGTPPPVDQSVAPGAARKPALPSHTSPIQ